MQFFADIYGHERFYRAAQELHRAVKVLKGYKEPQRVAQGRLEPSFAAQDPTRFYTAVHGRSGQIRVIQGISGAFSPILARGHQSNLCYKGGRIAKHPESQRLWVPANAISMEMCLSHSENQCFFLYFSKILRGHLTAPLLGMWGALKVVQGPRSVVPDTKTIVHTRLRLHPDKMKWNLIFGVFRHF